MQTSWLDFGRVASGSSKECALDVHNPTGSDQVRGWPALCPACPPGALGGKQQRDPSGRAAAADAVFGLDKPQVSSCAQAALVLLRPQVVHEERTPRQQGFAVVDADGRPLPAGAALAVPPGGRARLRVRWAPPPGAAGAVRAFMHLRWGERHQVTLGLAGSATARASAATAAAPTAAPAPAEAPEGRKAARAALRGDSGDGVGELERGRARGVGGQGAPAGSARLRLLGPAQRLALPAAQGVAAGDASAAPAPPRERDLAAAPAGEPGAASAVQQTAGARASCAEAAPRGNAENELPAAHGALSGPLAGAKCGPGRAARPSRALQPVRTPAQTPRREPPGGRAGEPGAAGAAAPRAARAPGTPGAPSAEGGAPATPRPLGAALRLNRRGAAAAPGPEASVAARKSFSFAHHGLWLEKQERALTVWLNAVLAPGGGAAGGEAGPGLSGGPDGAADTLTAGRLAAQLKGLLCRLCAADQRVIATMLALERRIDGGLLLLADEQAQLADVHLRRRCGRHWFLGPA